MTEFAYYTTLVCTGERGAMLAREHFQGKQIKCSRLLSIFYLALVAAEITVKEAFLK